MDNKRQFLLGQSAWCILDLEDASWSECTIDSDLLISEKGIQFYNVRLPEPVNSSISIAKYCIFSTKEELLDYFNNLSWGNSWRRE